MHIARWLIAPALLALLSAPLPACRKYIAKPPAYEAGVPGGTGGRTDGAGGSGGTGGGVADTNPDPTDGEQPDLRSPDRPDVISPDGPEPCGGKDAKCCPGNRCNDNGCCANGFCTPAFELCPEMVSGSCVGTSCGSICGGLKEPCCGSSGYCVKELTVCVRSTDGGAGKCESCGNTGLPCCRDNYCDFGRCMGGRCMP